MPDRGLGIAISAEDGSPRGLALVDDALLTTLRHRDCGPVRTFRGDMVGEMRLRLELDVHDPNEFHRGERRKLLTLLPPRG